MNDVLMVPLTGHILPLVLFGICFIVFAQYLSEIIEFRLSPKTIRLGGLLLLALGIGLFLYAYLNL